MILNDIEQMKLHDLLRQQGNLTSDVCWDAIEVFEKFLKDKQEPLSHEEINECMENSESFGFNGDVYIADAINAFENFARAIEKAHGIGVTMMSKEICNLNGITWVLGDEAPYPMTWDDANKWCKSIGQYLPPREVLLMAYINPEIRSEFANGGYWSSSKSDSYYVWYQNFFNGDQVYSNKVNTLSVRAVRAIKDAGLKREPLSEEDVVRKSSDYEFKICRNAFVVGVRWAEAQHNIGADDE